MEVIVQVQHFGITVSQPGEGFSMGNPVVGAHAGKMMPERMELVLVGILEFARGTHFFQMTQEGCLIDRGKKDTLPARNPSLPDTLPFILFQCCGETKRVQYLDVIRPFIGGGLATMPVAHCALHLRQ